MTSRAAGFSPPVARDAAPRHRPIPLSGGSRAYHLPMPTDDQDDPGADTAMFRAFVEDGNEPATEPATNRWVLVAVIVAVVVVLFGVLLLL
jgi:hypothetical protein